MIDQDYPIEYTRGWVEFFYQKFGVNEHVLIPRLETESLVRETIKHCRISPPTILIDIGTGSGIIPLSILSAVEIPEIFAVDLSHEALQLARENSLKQGRKIHFFHSDLLQIFLADDVFTKGKHIVITTNLPYIKQDDWDNMSSDTVHEPKLALFGGTETGFELYEKFFSQMDDFVQKYNPASLTVFAEMGEDQTLLATDILSRHGWQFSFFSDLR